MLDSWSVVVVSMSVVGSELRAGLPLGELSRHVGGMPL
jgi:hypothetical protein